jgi:hypothetical protein
MGQYESALAVLDAMPVGDNDMLRAFYDGWRGVILTLQEKDAQALPLVERYIEAYPDDIWGRELRAGILRKLGDIEKIADWKGGHAILEAPLFDEADIITASGSDDTLKAIRRKVPERCRFIGHGHKLSFIYLTKESLAGFNARKLIRRAAEDISAWDQAGCLSPHVIYVELNPDLPPEIFAERLATELERLEATHPRGPIAESESAQIASRRAAYEIRAAHSPDTRHWTSEGSTAWTVVFESEPQFMISCLNRFVYVKPVVDLDQLIKGIEPVHGRVSTVALAAGDDRANEIALRLAKWGVTRICPVGGMQDPSPAWRHDGRPALADFLTWTDWES